MEIDYYSDDFCASDIEEVTNIDELEEMQDTLQTEIWKMEEKVIQLQVNMGIVQERIGEVENET